VRMAFARKRPPAGEPHPATAAATDQLSPRRSSGASATVRRSARPVSPSRR
jgi:hypothetical protein